MCIIYRIFGAYIPLNIEVYYEFPFQISQQLVNLKTNIYLSASASHNKKRHFVRNG